jgi:hypothetical protein
MLCTGGWRLLLVHQFGMAALSIVTLLTAIMASIRLVHYASFTRAKVLVRVSAKAPKAAR